MSDKFMLLPDTMTGKTKKIISGPGVHAPPVFAKFTTAILHTQSTNKKTMV